MAFLVVFGSPGTATSAPEQTQVAPKVRPLLKHAAVVLKTVVVAQDGHRRLPDASDDKLTAVAATLDALLTDTAQDLGLTVDLTNTKANTLALLDDHALVAEARRSGGVLLSPRISVVDSDEIELRLVLASATSRTLLVRVERVLHDDAAVRAAVMLRDLVTSLGVAERSPRHAEVTEAPQGAPAVPNRSVGRATLAVNATLYGGLVGYSVQRSSGSEDPRLLYPLLAVGAGIGLGGSIVISEEWDVGLGDAWFLAASAWWPTLAGHFIYEGRFAAHATDADQERWAFGLVGGTTGIVLSTLGLALHKMSDGGALMAHSGGGLGMVIGGLTEVGIYGDIDQTPFAGFGYGAAFGWLFASALALQVEPSASRVLMVDLGALLGGLGGAALASPLVFDAPTPNEQRAWVGATATGLLTGATIAWLISKPKNPKQASRSEPVYFSLPTIGIVTQNSVFERGKPALGLQWRGLIP